MLFQITIHADDEPRGVHTVNFEEGVTHQWAQEYGDHRETYGETAAVAALDAGLAKARTAILGSLGIKP